MTSDIKQLAPHCGFN